MDLTPDKHDARNEKSYADQARHIDRALGKPHPSEVIESHRSEHLPRDEQRDKCGSADLRHKENGKSDENRSEYSTSPRPPWNARGYHTRRDRIAHRYSEQDHAQDADKIARESRPRSRVERCAQISIQDLLNDNTDPRQYGEDERCKSFDHQHPYLWQENPRVGRINQEARVCLRIDFPRLTTPHQVTEHNDGLS